MKLNTDYLDQSIATLEGAIVLLRQQEPGTVAYNIYRSACVKEFELIEEQSISLLRKRLRPYFASNRAVEELIVVNVFRHAVRRSLISDGQCERWFLYRQCRNNSAHNYNQHYADDVLAILPAFIDDAKTLSRMLAEEWDDGATT